MSTKYWSRGKLLSTPITRRWSKEEWDRGERAERMRVFAKSNLVCVVHDTHPDYEFNAALIESAPRLLHLIDTIINRPRLDEFDQSRESLKAIVSSLIKLRDNEKPPIEKPGPDDLNFTDNPFFL